MEQVMSALPPELRKNIIFDSKPLSPQEYEQNKADTYNAMQGDLDKADGYSCDLCKNRGYIAEVRFVETSGYYSETLVPCKCQRVRKALRRLQRSGLKDVVKKYTFDNYEALEPWQVSIKGTAERFCKELENHPWFFLGGQSGAGKTHICTAIAVYCIKHGMDTRYMLWRDEIARIKGLVTEPDKYAEAMNELKHVPVLYIDDLFKGGKTDDGQYKPPTAADINAAFEIINFRYNDPALITIISSERTIGELNDIDEAIAGRIAERAKAGGFFINLKRDGAKNYRMRGVIEL